MRRILPGLVLLLLCTSAPRADEGSAEASGDSPRIADLSSEIRGGVLLVSFRLVGALDPETRARIAAGLETTFDYRIEVLRRRRFWADARVRQYQLLTSVKYDSLARRYDLGLKMDGEVEKSSTTDRAEDMERWLTSIKEISLGPVADLLPPEEFSVRVKADFPPRFVFLFIPWDRDTAWVRIPFTAPPMTRHDTRR
ncbi:MAG TPA: DUF4390 domain-containing protein [Candidatus Polarisedimenticolia bacterium]|jgi:hypothetical protein|nr:DUF4390 domain-containing protein [Candidatus Polarisedimenticolia bacterium]